MPAREIQIIWVNKKTAGGKAMHDVAKNSKKEIQIRHNMGAPWQIFRQRVNKFIQYLIWYMKNTLCILKLPYHDIQYR